MKNFFTDLTSIYWWLSVVAVGVVINIVSAYFKTKLDAPLSNASTWWQTRSKKRRAQRIATLKKLREYPEERVILAVSEIKDRINFVYLVIITLGLFGAKAIYIFRIKPLLPGTFVTITFDFIVPLGAVVIIIFACSELLSAYAKSSLVRESSVDDADKG